MRIYISADIEGVTGVTNWEETERGGLGYDKACEQMTAEVAAACRGAFRAGATEILIKDAHDSARNLIPEKLPRGVKLIRGWCCDINSMMAEIDRGFDGAFLVGYHSEGHDDGNPLSHTMTYTRLFETKINGTRVSEMEMNAMIAATYDVPVALVTGDKGICERSEELLPGVITAAVKEGIGGATLNMHPLDAIDLIEEQAYQATLALKKGEVKPYAMPDHFKMELRFKEHMKAKAAVIYPGAYRVDEMTAAFESDDFRTMLTAYNFMS